VSTMFKIFIGNVNFKTTEEQLRKVFEPHMEIEDLVIARDPETGQSKGYGFVMTRDADEGRRAMSKIGKFMMDNRLVYLREAGGKKRVRKPKRRGGHRPPHRSRRPRPSRGGDLEPRINKPNVSGYTAGPSHQPESSSNRPSDSDRDNS